MASIDYSVLEPRKLAIPVIYVGSLAAIFIKIWMAWSAMGIRMDTIERQLESNRWRCTDQELYIARAETLNPGMRFPKIKDCRQ